MPANDELKPVKFVKNVQSSLGKLILLFYNFLQFLLWGRVGVGLVVLLVDALQKEGSLVDKIDYISLHCFANIGAGVILSQRVALLEVLFVFAGFLRSPLLSIVMQLLARNIVILLAIHQSHSKFVQQHFAVFICFVAWTLADFPRFMWLLQKTFGGEGPLRKILTSMRYSSFLVLYPLGGIGEAWSMYNTIGLGQQRDLLDVGLGIQQHFFVDMDVIVKFIYFPLFIPGFIFLYKNMLHRRQKNRGIVKSHKH
jgi:hypothetical protein